jgi:hypothetical protein
MKYLMAFLMLNNLQNLKIIQAGKLSFSNKLRYSCIVKHFIRN